MRLFHKRDAPPSDVVARLPAGERVVSWADVAGGGVVLATPAGLWWPEAGGQRLIGWHYVSKATWSERALAVIESDVLDELLLVDRPVVVVELAVPRDLPPEIRKRVTANVVWSEVLDTVGGSARFVARRVPGQDGLRWWARLEGPTPDTPHTRAAVSAQRDQLRAEHEARVRQSL